MTDTQRLWQALHEAGRLGVHSFDIRAELHMGNPSQRVADIEADHDCSVPRKRERRNGRMGVRYFHPDHAPAGLGDGSTPEAVVEPSRTPLEAAGAGAETTLSSLATSEPHAGDLERTDSKGEQLGLLATPPAIYSDAA